MLGFYPFVIYTNFVFINISLMDGLYTLKTEEPSRQLKCMGTFIFSRRFTK